MNLWLTWPELSSQNYLYDEWTKKNYKNILNINQESNRINIEIKIGNNPILKNIS